MKSTLVTLIFILTTQLAWGAHQSLKFMHPAPDHTLVKVKPTGKYLILPVEENREDSRIDVLVNGEKVTTLFVRLAENNVDYSVPFDLSPYAGKGEILLSIISPVNNREHSRQATEILCWNEMSVSDSFDTSNKEKYRPTYHHTPLYGWMNDPNGMFYKDGAWHLYYQHNPYGSKWQNMTWGHSSSTDLVHWTHHPEAIRPDGLGTIFSGNSVIDHDNTAGFGAGEVITLYTSCDKSQVQSLAHSSDNGMTFTKYPGNPVIVTPNEARDPNIFRNSGINKWNLVLAGAMDHEMHIFSSPDLKEWTYESSFGKGYGAQDGVWECPDLFQLDVPGTNEKKWVLLCNLNPGGKFGGSATQYFIGEFDGKKFTSDYAPEDTLWMDFGKDHYATVTWSDAPEGRRTAIGWMSNWQYANEVPTKQFRSANTLPRDLSLFHSPEGKLLLASKPAKELADMRGEARSYGRFSVSQKGRTFRLPDGKGMEIVMDYSLNAKSDVSLTLSNANGDKVIMTIDAKDMTFTMDRTKSGEVSFSRHFPAVTVAPLSKDAPAGTIRIFIDSSSIEAFDSEGRFAMTNLVFPTQSYSTITVKGKGKGKIKKLNAYKIK